MRSNSRFLNQDSGFLNNNINKIDQYIAKILRFFEFFS